MINSNILVLFLTILLCNGILTVLYLRQNRNLQRQKERKALMREKMIPQLASQNSLTKMRELFPDPEQLYWQIKEVRDVYRIPEALKPTLLSYYHYFNFDLRCIRRLRRKDSLQRKKATLMMTEIPSERGKRALMNALLHEKNPSVALYMIYALLQWEDSAVIPSIIDKITELPEPFKARCQSMVAHAPMLVYSFFPALKIREEDDIRKLLLLTAEEMPSTEFGDYAEELFTGKASPLITRKAFRVLLKNYPSRINLREQLKHRDESIRKMAVRGLAQQENPENLPLLFTLMKTKSLNKEAINALEELVKKNKRLLPGLFERYGEEENQEIKKGILHILSGYMEYFLGRSGLKESPELTSFLRDSYREGLVTGLTTFLAKNRNLSIENIVILSLKDHLNSNPAAYTELREYLPERLLAKLNIKQKVKAPPQEKEAGDKKKQKLFILLAIAFLLFPLLYLLSGRITPEMTQGEFLSGFVIFFNYGFGFYSIAINMLYLFILILSAWGIRRQKALWEIKTHTFLYQPDLLPSISIIAPAYNEETTIIESVNSLLSLDYPDFEVIVVNDGSRDATLDTLIRYYELERVRWLPESDLKTKRVRGIYASPRIPHLKIIDKRNGGKADSLNTGINYSSREYFAGIDSDSLLEDTALLKLISSTLDETVEPIALGGNILPVNNCKVKHGYIQEKHIPENRLARIQGMEYIRSFMAGRVGWAMMNSLLIISGAFGVFKRSRVIEFHGYLTSSEQYKKDTVGEDMEIVVRLSKRLSELKKPHKVLYLFNANCWTEVPEDRKVFVRQRDRWQRGLIDIITYHKEMMLNPKYKTKGLFAFPYFLIFEILGPWFEFQGYLFFILSIFLGLMDPTLFLFLFTVSVLFGMLISLSSLILSSEAGDPFPFREQLKLLRSAFIENFGIRQLISFIRLKGFISALKNVRGWGKMTRKGIKSS